MSIEETIVGEYKKIEIGSKLSGLRRKGIRGDYYVAHFVEGIFVRQKKEDLEEKTVLCEKEYLLPYMEGNLHVQVPEIIGEDGFEGYSDFDSKQVGDKIFILYRPLSIEKQRAIVKIL